MGATVRMTARVLAATLVILAAPRSSRAQVFVDFDDWTDACPDETAPECEVRVEPGGSASRASLASGAECYFGQCLRVRWDADGTSVWMGLEEPVEWTTVYFEARIRLPPAGSELYPGTGDRIGLAKIEDREAGLSYLVSLDATMLTVTRRDLTNPMDSPVALRDGIPDPSEWTRVAVLIDAVTAVGAEVTLWLGDGDPSPSSRTIDHRIDGTDLRFTAFDEVFGLGRLATSSVNPRELYIDDVCFAPSASARDDFCPARAADRVAPDGGVADAGTDSGARDAVSGSQTTFRGVGGCDCSPAGAPTGRGAALLASLLVLSLLGRRRRRR